MEINQNLSDLKDAEKRLNTLRFLREYVTKNSVSEVNEFIPALKELFEDPDELVRRLSWQVLFNSTVNRPDFAEIVIESLKNDIPKRLEIEVPKTQNVICALMKQNVQHFSDLNVFKTVLNIDKNADQVDFAVLLACELSKNCDLVEKLDQNLKIHVYKLYQNMLENEKLDQNSLDFLVKQFKKSSQSLLTTFKNQDHLDPIEVSRILEILAQASSTDQFKSRMQNDMSLLIECIYLLRMIHDAQKPITSMDQVGDPDSPVYGLKCNLIRIIANMVYRNKTNQDQVDARSISFTFVVDLVD